MINIDAYLALLFMYIYVYELTMVFLIHKKYYINLFEV